MDDYKGKRIAVVGVSEREEKFGYKIFHDLLLAGYPVEAVNKRGGKILGRKIYASLAELEAVPELVITVVPPKISEQIVEECHSLGIREIWMQPGSESEAAIQTARDYGISVIYNACFMVKSALW